MGNARSGGLFQENSDWPPDRFYGEMSRLVELGNSSRRDVRLFRRFLKFDPHMTDFPVVLVSGRRSPPRLNFGDVSVPGVSSECVDNFTPASDWHTSKVTVSAGQDVQVVTWTGGCADPNSQLVERTAWRRDRRRQQHDI